MVCRKSIGSERDRTSRYPSFLEVARSNHAHNNNHFTSGQAGNSAVPLSQDRRCGRSDANWFPACKVGGSSCALDANVTTVANRSATIGIPCVNELIWVASSCANVQRDVRSTSKGYLFISIGKCDSTTSRDNPDSYLV